MEPRRPENPDRSRTDKIIGYKILHEKNDALQIITEAEKSFMINKDSTILKPGTNRSYQTKTYIDTWYHFHGYDKVEEGNVTRYKLWVSGRSFDFLRPGGDPQTLNLTKEYYVYLPVECEIVEYIFGVYGVLIGADFVVTRDRQGKETYEMINKILRLTPGEVVEMKKLGDKRWRNRNVKEAKDVVISPQSSVIVDVKGIPDAKERAIVHDTWINIRGNKTSKEAAQNASKVLEKVRELKETRAQARRGEEGNPVLETERKEPVQPMIYTEQVMRTGLGQTGLLRNVRPDVRIVEHNINGMIYTVREGKEYIEEFQMINGVVEGMPFRYERPVQQLLSKRPAPVIAPRQEMMYGVSPFQFMNQGNQRTMFLQGNTINQPQLQRSFQNPLVRPPVQQRPVQQPNPNVQLPMQQPVQRQLIQPVQQHPVQQHQQPVRREFVPQQRPAQNEEDDSETVEDIPRIPTVARIRPVINYGNTTKTIEMEDDSETEEETQSRTMSEDNENNSSTVDTNWNL